MSALDVQVGGEHYRTLKIQPAEYCHANNIPKLEGDAIYYLTRWRAKNGLEDLRKARHTISLLIELEERAQPVAEPPKAAVPAGVKIAESMRPVQALPTGILLKVQDYQAKVLGLAWAESKPPGTAVHPFQVAALQIWLAAGLRLLPGEEFHMDVNPQGTFLSILK